MLIWMTPMKLRTLTPALTASLCAATVFALSPAAAGADSGTGTDTGVTLTAAKSGAQFTSVQAAVDAVPDNSTTPYTISIGRGTYEETVTVPVTKLHLSLVGATGDPRDVVIDAAHYNGEATATGGTFGTEGSATVHVKANDFTAEYVTFSNTFDKTKFPTVTGTQAVAIAMEGDRQVYAHDAFVGHQDTLLTWDSSATKSLRQYVFDSTISGDVDYIFGNGSLVVDRSHIVALNDGIYQKAYLTAPATYGTDAYGILITGSTVTSTLAPNQVYLGRAWTPYAGAVPQLVIRDTNLPAQMNASNPYLGISNATWTAGRYFEYGDTGFGANAANPTRPQLADTDQATYTAAAYLAGDDGWNPVAAPGAQTVADQAALDSGRIGDTRDVAEPSLPATCTTVTSQLPAPVGRVFADAQEAAPPDTARIQAALAACAGTGQAVVLAADGADTAFLSAPLTVGSSEILVVGAGVTLYASRNAADYQGSGAVCGSIGASGTGCNAFINVTGVNAGIEGVRTHSHDHNHGDSASPARSSSDDDFVQGTIDGRGDLPVLGTTASWWDLAVTAKAEGLKQVNPRLIQATGADNLTVYDVTLTNAAKQHLYYKNGGGLVVWGLKIDTVDTALNTDGIDFDSSAYGTVRDSYIQDGDDCIAMQTNNATDVHITFMRNQCFGTHGISIGSETTFGLEQILVEHNSISGVDANGTESSIAAGLRIKSYAGVGGNVTDVVYRDTTMSSLMFPIDIDPFYATPTGTSTPWFTGVEIDHATETGSVPGAQSVLEGIDAGRPLGLTLHDVKFDTSATKAQYADINARGTNLTISGPGVTVTR
jgi:pectin methylesterase-like acyl-CoA thioesterase